MVWLLFRAGLVLLAVPAAITFIQVTLLPMRGGVCTAVLDFQH